MRIGMVGTGYVGLVSGTCFAEFGHTVICVDKDAAKIERLKNGEIPIFEPGLEELLKRQIESGRIQFTTDIAEAVSDSEAVFIAVGTPSRRYGRDADMSYVHGAAREIAQNLKGYTVVVNKSTVPVGTARDVEGIIAEENASADFDVASNPEFLREGAAIDDFMRPDRVVVGTSSEKAQKVMRDAPALTIVPILQQAGAIVAAYDPEAMDIAKDMMDDVIWCDNPYEVAQNADVLSIVTEWNEFRALDLPRVREAMSGNVFADLRNVYKAEDMKGKGFHYISIGRAVVEADATSPLKVSA